MIRRKEMYIKLFDHRKRRKKTEPVSGSAMGISILLLFCLCKRKEEINCCFQYPVIKIIAARVQRRVLFPVADVKHRSGTLL